ncbi:Hypothetical predicted protein [Drosophila guanche]|uniref:Uncharacterized protein n=1 Tax=Drosophila guanche TaxID=7266 RepID=A0A3B0KEQ7_DROGU|nr:Hypothetical predicted protein [Drosophila guanche]
MPGGRRTSSSPAPHFSPPATKRTSAAGIVVDVLSMVSLALVLEEVLWTTRSWQGRKAILLYAAASTPEAEANFHLRV